MQILNSAPVIKTETAVAENKDIIPYQVNEPAQEKYHVIGGCFKMKENADKLLERLRAEGFKSKVNQFSNGNFMVTVQSYADRNEAQLALNTLRELEPAAGYWLLIK